MQTQETVVNSGSSSSWPSLMLPKRLMARKSAKAPGVAKGAATEDLRTGTSPRTIAHAVLDNLRYVQGRLPEIATSHDWYKAFAYTVRDRLVDRWMDTIRTITEEKAKAVCYLSAEFLMGPHLGNGLLNLGIMDEAREAATHPGFRSSEQAARINEGALTRQRTTAQLKLQTYVDRGELRGLDEGVTLGDPLALPPAWTSAHAEPG